MTPNEEWGLLGKVAIVTGGGAQGDGIGNGRAAAILLARAGANVLVVDRDLALAERTVAMIAGEGGNAVAVSYDVTESGHRAAMVEDGKIPLGRHRTASTTTLGIGEPGVLSWKKPKRTALASCTSTWTACSSLASTPFPQ